MRSFSFTANAITPAASSPGIRVRRKERRVVVIQAWSRNSALAGPIIAPSVSIMRSKPNARP